MGAVQSDQYSWIARVDETYAFTAEVDHVDKENNLYRHKEGTFHKVVRPLSAAHGDAPQTIRHGEELYNAVAHAHRDKLEVRLLLVRGTKYGTSEGGIRAALDPDLWTVTRFSGDLNDGFQFVLERTQNAKHGV